MDMTIDDFLGGKVRLKQGKTGYRATSDSVLTAAAVPVRTGESVLDVGTGSGIILLCLNARAARLALTGVEMQADLCALARENALLNQANVKIIEADISKKVPEIQGVQFHHVVTNPPFYTEGRVRKEKQTALAYHQQLDAEKWLAFCVRHIRAKGTLTVIQRTEMLPAVLAFLSKTAVGALEVIPICGKAGECAKRVIIRGKMGSKKGLTLQSPLIMHTQTGERTQTAEDILRNGIEIA